MIRLFYFKSGKKAPGYFAASYSSMYPEQTDFGEIKENSEFILNALDKRCEKLLLKIVGSWLY